MQFENFDNKVKQAAEQHHPNYDEKAWAKMEKLLDRHLPQNKDRRRVIFFLLFFLLAGGGAWLVISKPWQKNDQITGVENTQHKTVTGPPDGSLKEGAGKITNTNSSPEEKKDKGSIIEPAGEKPVDTNEKKNDLVVKDAVGRKQEKDQSLVVSDKQEKINNNRQGKIKQGNKTKTDELAIDVTSPGKMTKDRDPSESNMGISSTGNKNDIASKNDIKPGGDLPVVKNDITNKTSDTKKNDISEEQPKTDEKSVTKKNPVKKSNSFFFSFSAGPDISSVSGGKPGKVQLSAGAGVGYTIKNRLTLRAGFYTGRKVYSANKEDYKPSVQPPNYYYLEEDISADCKVYEIPVSFAWNFGQSTKHNMFASAGLSSYIMKKETYHYTYKYPGGQPYPVTKTLSNENKHYFSVLTLSGGYQRRINKTFSVAAEPYIKLPLTGIGFGNVKLNSAGILFSVNISPFQK